jgi:uncharacterized membrane protein
MEYIFGVSALWFTMITVLTLYGIAKYETLTPVDILIGMVISPALAFISAALFMWSME